MRPRCVSRISLFSLLAVAMCLPSSAQSPGKDGPMTVGTLNTVLNEYGILAADAATGAKTVDVTDPGGADGLDPATLTANDLLLMIQMQGATMDSSYRVVDFGSGNDESYAVALQSDGKIVVAGYSDNGSDQDFALMRFNADGTPDTSFDGDGAVTTSIGGANEQAIAVAIQNDGKIVAAGFADVGGGNEDFALVRYDPDGSLDLSFGAGGKVTTPVLGVNDQARAVAIQSDGMIVAVGWANNGADNDVAVVRYDAGGVPDPLFGAGGIVTTPIGPGDDEGFAVAMQTDDKIVVAGDSANAGANDDIVVLRYLTGGGLDPGFGVGGIATTPIGAGDDSARALALQSDGKIVVSGSTWNGTDFDFAIARYDVGGALDAGFGTAGITTIPVGASNDLSYGVALQADGKIVSTGWTHNGDDWDFGLTRLTSTGSLDTSFDVDGKVSAPVGNDDAYGEGVVIHPDGRIFVVGPSENSVDLDFTLVGFNADGTYSYGTVLDYGGAGRYELVPVTSVAGSIVTLGCSLANSYTASGHTQIVRVPQYTTLTVNGGASVIAPAWNGQYGGVVALHVQGVTTIDGQIGVDRRGFRGGSLGVIASADQSLDWPDLVSTFPDVGGEKGEGIAGDVNVYDNVGGRYGRGAPANGGGGGSAHNAAGGGGANGNAGGRWTGQGFMDGTVLGNAAWALDPGYINNGNALTTSPGGGRGGYSFADTDLDALTNGPGVAGWGGNARRERGGLGGHPLPNSASRLFMGGGGGAGDHNGGGGGAGGNGGGIALLISDSVAGAGVIDARGEPGDDTTSPHEDPPGGGGAGGTVVVIASSSLSGINITADGGPGGNQGFPAGFPDESEGPGGGGGGGFIATSGGVVARTADGGASGTSLSNAVTEFPTNGSTNGAPGQPNELIASVPGRCLASGCAPQINYRSVGTDAGILHQDGLATINAGSNVVTFSGAANIPTYVGRGDELVIGATTFYILSRVSSTEVTVQSVAGATLTDQAYTIRRAYNAFQSWETASEGNLVGDGRREVAYAYDDGARGFGDFGAGAIISGSTTDACHFMHITVAPGQRHLGRTGSGVLLDGVNAAQVFQVRDEYTRIEWLAITGATVVNGVIFVDSDVTAPGQHAFLSHLLIHNFTSVNEGALQLSHDATVRNSIIYDGDRGIQVDEGATATIENVTVYNMTTYGVQAGDQGVTDVTIRNTISVGNGWNDFALDDTISYFGYNMFDTTALFDPVLCAGCVGNNQTPPVLLDNLFVSVTGAVDLHLEGSSNAVDTGLDLSSMFASDIDAQSRALGAGWDIGADEALAAVGGTCPVDNPLWYDANWLSRMPVVVNASQVAISLTDFPALLQLSSSAALAADAQNDGDDILFTLADGITKVSHEIELFDGGTGELVAWIEVPYLSSGSDTVLYMYYGNPTVGSQQDVFGTWSNGYEGVWHLSEASGAGAYILNSTENDHHGTPDGTSFNATGRIAGARDFSDTGTHGIDLANSTAFFDGWGQFSYEFWMRNDYTSDAEWEGVGEHLVFDETGGAPVRLIRIRRQGFNPAGKGEIQSDIEFAGAGTQFVIETIDRQAWNHVLYSYNGSNLKIFVDGVIVRNDSIPGDALSNNFGAIYSIGGNFSSFRGTLDEVRFASAGRSDGWAETQYNNQSDPSGFFNVCAAVTAVELESFEAKGVDTAIEVSWTTASELDNLGFHLYRSTSADGGYQRVSSGLIPGLGSSPVGATYSFRDEDVVAGVTYYYELEDVDTSGTRTLHGPVAATTGDGDVAEPGDGSAEEPLDGGGTRIRYGSPSETSLVTLHRDEREVEIELRTEGFWAEPLGDGTVAIEIPELVHVAPEGAPDIPVRRAWIEAAAGRDVRLISVREYDVERISGLVPKPASGGNVVMDAAGTVRARATRARRRSRRGGGAPVHLVSVGYQGSVKKALVEMRPLRWDERDQELVLSKRLVVRLRFTGTERKPAQRRWRDSLVRQLVVRDEGIHAVTFEALFGSRHRGLDTATLRLSRLDHDVPYHVEPDRERFERGSTLYFFSEGPSLNPYGREAVYELETDAPGALMPVVDASPMGADSVAGVYWTRSIHEENRYYQPALVHASDPWLWELVFGRETKSFPFELERFVDGAVSTLEVRLQGASDAIANPDHHVRLFVNGRYAGETSWDGKEPRHLDVSLYPGVLRNGANVLEIENVGDTGAEYSLVMLDRFEIRYPRRAKADASFLEGSWGVTGTTEVQGLGAGVRALDVTAEPRWLVGLEETTALRLRVEAGRDYVLAGGHAILAPEVRRVAGSRLLERNRVADYLVIGPRSFIDASRELVEHRRSQGLRVVTLAIEDVYTELGFGEARPEAVRDAIAHAYHHWGRAERPLRYVLLLGDATYDFKDYHGLGVQNQVPPYMVRTSYLWTASDPSLAAVHGDDALPDLAIGRLPASSAEQVRMLAHKIVLYETERFGTEGPIVLVTDNPDGAGDFVADAESIATGLLGDRDVRRIHLAEQGTSATRDSIVDAFDRGASVMSYLGHGGIHLWASENLFNTAAVSRLSPQARQPIVLTMNCLNGYFHFPFFESLGEALVESEGRGAIAAISPTGLSLNEPADRFHRELLSAILDGRHQRLGDAMMAATEAYAESGAFPELVQIYHLFGDPALQLR